jgi:hypothetical protein
MLLRRLRLTVKSSPNRSMETGDGKGAISPLEAYCQAFQRLLDGKTRSSPFMSHPLSLSRFHYLLPLHIRTLAHTRLSMHLYPRSHTRTPTVIPLSSLIHIIRNRHMLISDFKIRPPEAGHQWSDTHPCRRRHLIQSRHQWSRKYSCRRRRPLQSHYQCNRRHSCRRR